MRNRRTRPDTPKRGRRTIGNNARNASQSVRAGNMTGASRAAKKQKDTLDTLYRGKKRKK